LSTNRTRVPVQIAAGALAAAAVFGLTACSGAKPPAGTPASSPASVSPGAAQPTSDATAPDAPGGGDAGGAAGDAAAAAAAAQWLVQNLADGTHAEIEYDNEMFNDGGLTIDAMWALVAAGQTEAAGKAADWLAQRGNAIDYAGDGEQAAYPSAMGKLGLAYLTPGVAPAPQYKSAPDLAGLIAGRLSPEGRFRDISEWGDNSTPAGQAFDILLLVKLGALDGLTADPVAGLEAIACPDGSYPEAFDADPPCLGDVATTAIIAQALLAAGQTQAADRAFDHLLAAQVESGRWQSFGTDSVSATALAVAALGLVDTPEAKNAAALGLAALRGWQLARTGAFPAADAAEGELRATAHGILALTGTSHLDLLGIPPG
jgi:hypothetical protein